MKNCGGLGLVNDCKDEQGGRRREEGGGRREEGGGAGNEGIVSDKGVMRDWEG